MTDAIEIERLYRRCEKLEAELDAEREFADRLAAELARWGWGDHHYGDQPQEASIVALLDEHCQRRTPI